MKYYRVERAYQQHSFLTALNQKAHQTPAVLRNLRTVLKSEVKLNSGTTLFFGLVLLANLGKSQTFLCPLFINQSFSFNQIDTIK